MGNTGETLESVLLIKGFQTHASVLRRPLEAGVPFVFAFSLP